MIVLDYEELYKKSQVQVAQLMEQVSDLTAQVTLLNASIIELSRRLNQNSSNSGKPSSSNPYKKPNSKHNNTRQKTDKTIGGQIGHKGTTVQKFETADEIIDLDSAICPICGNKMEPVSDEFIAKQYVDVVMKRFVKEYRSYELVCTCGNKMQCPFPEGIVNPVEYSSTVKLLVPYLSNVQMISMNRIQEMLVDLFDLHISQGTIATYNRNMIQYLHPFQEVIKAQLLMAPFMHCDETGARVMSLTQWIHIAVYDNLYYLYPHKNRGTEAFNAEGIIPHYRGIVVHDHWRPYFTYENCDHAMCMEHILRDLKSVVDGTGDNWAIQMRELIQWYYHNRKELIAQNITSFSETLITEFIELYDAILEEGWTTHCIEYPPIIKKSGKPKNDYAMKLIIRMQKFKEAYTEWVYDFRCPFENNKAESGLRMIKTKAKVSGCFRSEEGIKASTLMRSYIQTVRASGEKAFEQLKNAVEDNCYIPILKIA